MSNSVFKKFIEYGIGSVITLLLGFISSPIITRIIGPEENGKFSIFNTVTNLLLVIVVLGLDQAYVRYYYEESEENRGKLLRQCIKFPCGISLILGIVIMFFYRPLSIYIVQENSILVVIILILNLFISIISRFSMLQIRMRQRAKLYSFINIIMKIINLIFIIGIFFVYENNYMTLILAMIFTNLFATILGVIIEKKEWCKKGNEKLATTNKELIKYGLPLVFSMAITWIFQSIDKITIKEFSGYLQVGLYSGAMSIVSLLNAVQNTFTTFWAPVAFERYCKNPSDKAFFCKINKIVSVTMLFLAIGLILFKDLVVLLLGSKYREAVFIFPYLVFMPIMYTISETTVVGINFKKNPKAHIYIAIISAIFNLLGNIILVPKLGAKGAAISTGLAYIVFFIVRTYFSNKYYSVNYNLARFAISTIVVYVLATYSSFYRFNLIILFLSIISFVIIGILYRDIIKELISLIRKKYKFNRK